MVKSPTNAAKEEITKSFDKAAINAPADLKDTAQEDDVEPPPDNALADDNSDAANYKEEITKVSHEVVGDKPEEIEVPGQETIPDAAAISVFTLGSPLKLDLKEFSENISDKTTEKVDEESVSIESTKSSAENNDEISVADSSANSAIQELTAQTA